LAQAVQGSGGVPIPGGVRKPCGCGTLGHGLGGGDGLAVGLEDLGGLFQPKRFYDYTLGHAGPVKPSRGPS